jgi:hypothetical protein
MDAPMRIYLRRKQERTEQKRIPDADTDQANRMRQIAELFWWRCVGVGWDFANVRHYIFRVYFEEQPACGSVVSRDVLTAEQ